MKTSIEKVRRRDLVEAAFQTFLDHGIGGATMARIGEQAGMSHGIVNYYFKSKDQLLSAVIRHAFRRIMREVVRRLKDAETPRQRVSAIIAGNFPDELFNRETASAWISFYAEVSTHADFEHLQDTFYRRLHSNLIHALKQLTSAEDAERIALGVSVWIDGLWLRRAMKRQGVERPTTIRAIEEYTDLALAQSAPPARNRARVRAAPRAKTRK